MTTILNSEEIEKYLNEIENATYIDEEEGDHDNALSIYLEVWNKLPEPKHQQPESIASWIISCIYGNYFEREDYINAKKWAIIGLDNDEIKEKDSISVGEFMDMAKVCYELNEYDEALKYFELAYKRMKYGAFQEEEKKYWKFYKEKKQIKK